MSHPLNPRRNQPISPRAFEGQRPGGGVPMQRLQDAKYRENQQRRGGREIVRSSIVQSTDISVNGWALVKSLASGANFSGVSGPVLHDGDTTEETRLLVSVSGAIADAQHSVLALLNLDSTSGIPGLGLTWTAHLKCGTIIVPFDYTTVTWATQPDITDPTKVVVGGPTLSGPGSSIAAASSGAIQLDNIIALATPVITGFVFYLDTAVGRTICSNFSNIDFRNVTLV